MCGANPHTGNLPALPPTGGSLRQAGQLTVGQAGKKERGARDAQDRRADQDHQVKPQRRRGADQQTAEGLDRRASSAIGSTLAAGGSAKPTGGAPGAAYVTNASFFRGLVQGVAGVVAEDVIERRVVAESRPELGRARSTGSRGPRPGGWRTDNSGPRSQLPALSRLQRSLSTGNSLKVASSARPI